MFSAEYLGGFAYACWVVAYEDGFAVERADCPYCV